MKSNNKPKQSTNNKKRIIGDSNSRLVAGTLVGFMLVLMSSVFYGMQNAYATASSLSVSVTDGANPSVNIPPTTEGKFVASGATTFTVTTTHAAGYTVTAKSTALKDSTNTISTLTLPSGTSGITEASYEDNDYASKNNLNNTWGYLPSNLCTTSGTTTTCAANTLYLPAPISATQTLDEVSSATGNTYDINIGTRVTTDTAQGAYATTFTVAVVGNATPYSITYNKNTTDAVNSMPANHTTSDEGASGEAVTLASNTPSRTNYEFQGWCTVAVSTGASCTGTSYSAGGTWTLNQTSSSNSLALYAMWKASGYTITFKANGGTGSDYTQTISGTDYLSGNSFARNNYYFKGWGTSTSTVAYRPGQSITPTGNMTLYAIWASSTSSNLYNIVGSLTRSTQTAANLRATITKDNSGVYTYNSSVFGAASDASTSNNIYYYRGILDNVLGTSGSNGDGGNYPNFVILQAGSSKATTDTCWRIVRTTGSGGVKMIYNGKWTGSTCANAQSSAQVTTQAFGLKGNSSQSGTNWNKNINRVGYTFNNDSSIQDSTTETSVDTVFGSNSNYSTTNTANSNIKTYIENTWFTSINSWASKLEPSAGYCNDRMAYSNAITSTALSVIAPYKTSLATMYFGAYGRNANAAGASQAPSLACSRNVVDLYTAGSASNGNKQLSKPAALLTADEASFAGSGFSVTTGGSTHHGNSYLRSNSDFWLLTPYYRFSYGPAGGFYLNAGGYLSSESVSSSSYGIRPVISLASGTRAASGSGTATNPWVVKP